MKGLYWVLDGATVREAKTAIEWANGQTKRHRIGLAQRGVLSISTIFIGLTSRENGPLFETMIFGPEGHPFHHYQRRHYTLAEAVEGHRRALRLVRWYRKGPRKLKKKISRVLRDPWPIQTVLKLLRATHA